MSRSEHLDAPDDDLGRSNASAGQLADHPASQALLHAELAAFLHARRSALQPEDVGLTRTPRRRVRGLRREEVARRASVSVTWYTWLEQARNIRTTPQVLDALSSALQLDAANHRHLRRLGGHPISGAQQDDQVPDTVEASLHALVDEQMPAPALLIRPNGDLVKWNAAVSRLWFDPDMIPPERRNGLIMLTSDTMRTKLVDWEDHCRRVTAGFRAAASKRLGDPRTAHLVEMLTEASGIFQEAWVQNEVKRTAGDRYVLQSSAGAITTEQIALRPICSPMQILLVHRLVDEVSRTRMLKLLSDGPV
jgi:transcriptional regulator with XRE-family HTH domain